MQYRVARVNEVDWSGIEAVELVHQPWLEPCHIEAKAQLCHDGENLYVRMEAKEKNIRAQAVKPYEAVCVDSCMEFFFAPQKGDLRYFNLEWNLLKTLCLGFGRDRLTRARLLLKDNGERFDPKTFRTEDGWGIEYKIPVSFIRDYFPDFAFEGEAACNFYKCGDLTEKEHYLAWAPLSSEKPDFHRPQDFGTMIFE